MQDLLFELVSSCRAERGALLCRGGCVCVRAGVCRVLIPAQSPPRSICLYDLLQLLDFVFPFPRPEQGAAGN